MRRSEAREGQRVRVKVKDTERIGTIQQVGDQRLPGLRHAARVIFRDCPEVGAIWAPIEDLKEIGDE